MQITDFTFSKLELSPISSNVWKLAKDVHIRINQPADKGYRFILKEGFATNLRSGSDFLNPFIPRNGDEDMTISYILHDALYTEQRSNSATASHLTGKDFADDLLKAMLQFCDECTNCMINGLKENLKNEKDKSRKKEIGKEIKFHKDRILGSFKIWSIHKAVSLFGKSAWNEKAKIPFDQNFNKVFIEVL
jgi:hypothetical protein